MMSRRFDMWSYYGSKANMAKRYPKPTCDKIIEAFAGSAKYSLQHFEKDVLLVDKYQVIIDIWEYLQRCSPADILKLPNLKAGQTLNDFNFDCGAAKSLMGFIVQYGVASPGLKPSPMKLKCRSNFINYTLKKIAGDLYKIKHWKFECKSYLDIENQKATWFLDPPYQKGGHKYVESNKNINFSDLGIWSKQREGQLIVCENMQADWLPFVPMMTQHGSKGSQKEAIYTNTHTHYNNIQQTIF